MAMDYVADDRRDRALEGNRFHGGLILRDVPGSRRTREFRTRFHLQRAVNRLRMDLGPDVPCYGVRAQRLVIEMVEIGRTSAVGRDYSLVPCKSRVAAVEDRLRPLRTL
jgi:hypothetical protein